MNQLIVIFCLSSQAFTPVLLMGKLSCLLLFYLTEIILSASIKCCIFDREDVFFNMPIIIHEVAVSYGANQNNSPSISFGGENLAGFCMAPMHTWVL